MRRIGSFLTGPPLPGVDPQEYYSGALYVGVEKTVPSTPVGFIMVEYEFVFLTP